MQNSLLAHVASNFISEYENVANSCVAYLLNNYIAAREALKATLNIDNAPSFYITELSTESNGRPDVTGLDDSGNKKIIIEGKFWANLTDNQPNNYLKELSDDGKVLFLSPSLRVISLQIEINSRLNSEFNEKIIIRSWDEFINQVEKENNKTHNSTLASDLLEIRELCKKNGC